MPSIRRQAISFFALALLVMPLPIAAQAGAFGNSVVIDGDALIIGEPNNTFRPGVVYVYEKINGTWTETSLVTAPNAERADGFGAVLALSGNSMFVANRGGAVHEYERAGGSWSFARTVTDDESAGLDPRCDFNGYCGVDYGIGLATADGWILVGHANVSTDRTRLRPRRRQATDDVPDEPAGEVVAFERQPDGSWSETQRLQSPASAGADGFGAALAVLGDRLLVGAPGAAGVGEIDGAGRVFEFTLSGDEWRHSGELSVDPNTDATFGSPIVTEGDRVVIGAPFNDLAIGAAFAFELDPTSGNWSDALKIQVPEAQEGDSFGAAIAVSDQALWIGAPVTRGLETGIAFVLGDETVEQFRFTEEETNNEDSFGHRIAASGNVVAVTAAGLDHQAGGVFVYERGPDGTWAEPQVLVSPPDALGAVLGEERRCTDGAVGEFGCTDIELYAYVPISMLTAPEDARGVRVNDNWGWTDSQTDREYALVGRNDGTSFIDITDPMNPVLIGDLPKTAGTPRSQLWRDIKTFDDHAYIVADGAGAHGMQIFNLARLRNVETPPVTFEPDVLYRGVENSVVESSHNVIINEETGFAYLTSRGCSGLHMIDINDPLNPVFVGCSEPGSTHDAQCVIYRGPDAGYVGHEICLRMSGNRFQISDVTDKANPVELSTASHPNPAYMHQGWVTEDHRYFIMDDESDVIAGNVETTRTLIWDLDDLEDPVLAKEFFGSLPASAHNLYVKGDLTYQANYNYGLHILDISDPLNPVEVGMFDTSPYRTGAGFGGAWSTYPFFESGTIIVTSMQEGLFMLKKRVRPIS
jgi:choice-of-anchor B domain-containing protein